MRKTWLPLLLCLLFSCNGDTVRDNVETGVVVDADTDADTDADSDSDTDTDIPDAAPVAVDDDATLNEGDLSVIDVLANDTDVNGDLDSDSVLIVDDPLNGTVTVNADGTVDYEHDGSETADDSFTYTVDDLAGATSNIATVFLTVEGANDAPVAIDDVGEVTEGGAGNFDLAANDIDSDDGLDLNSILIISSPSFGAIVVNADGTVDYTHDSSETIDDSFTYTIGDLAGAISNIATVTIVVSPQNDAPVANDDAAAAGEGNMVNVDLAANDTDTDDGIDPTSIAIQTSPLYGSVVLNGDGTVDYSHDGSESLADSFTYTINDYTGTASNIAVVTLTITAGNDAPTAVDDAGALNEGGAANIDVAANDTDPDDALDLTSVAVITGPTYGSLVVNADGTVDYTHDGSETVADSFTYTIDDASGATSNIATVSLYIGAVNDAPTAADDASDVDEGAQANFDLAINDSDSDDGLDLDSISIQSAPAYGSIAVNNDGTVDYTHDGSESATDSFTYTIDDIGGNSSNTATVDVTIAPINDLPVANDDNENGSEGGNANFDVVANDTDADDGVDPGSTSIVAFPTYGAASVNGDGTVSYTHDGSENLSDSFTYTVQDYAGALSNVATVSITIGAVNDPPTAGDDSGILVNEGGGTVIDLAANDSDSDDGLDLGSISVQAAPSRGSLVLNGDGTANYTHDGSETLADTFTYIISDNLGSISNVATVTIQVLPVNDAPVANDDAYGLSEGAGANLGLAANDIDVDNALDLNSIAIVSASANGTLSVNFNGTVDYIHDGSETVSDSFTYTILDAAGLISNVATVDLTITPVNDAPIANDDAVNADEGLGSIFDLAANDTDADDGLDLSSINILITPNNGVVSPNGDGTVTYLHDGSETAVDAFTYTIRDFAGATSNTGTVNITINEINDLPVANNDADIVDNGQTVNLSLSGNDIDVDGTIDGTSITIIANPASGSVAIIGNGSVDYTHDGGATLNDSFTYTIDDNDGGTSNVAAVSLTINPGAVPNTCEVANGLTWCFHPTECGKACNDTCAANGLVPVDTGVWFAAQDSIAECTTIAAAFGNTDPIRFVGFTYACLEDTPNNHTPGGGPMGSFHCSSSATCTNAHLTQMDQLGIACGAGSRLSICACQ